MDILKKKQQTHQVNGVHENDRVIGMKWKSKSVWLLSIYHNPSRFGLPVSMAEATLFRQ